MSLSRKPRRVLIQERWRRLPSGQRGNTLPVALIVLLFSTLVLMPVFEYARSRQAETMAYESGLNAQYAADAGIEYGVWKLANVASFRDQVALMGSAGVSLTVPSAQNGIAATVRAMRLHPEFEYALYANGTGCGNSVDMLDLNGNNTIIGKTHSNGEINSNNNTDFQGLVEYYGNDTPHGSFTPSTGNPIAIPAPTILPPLRSISDYNNPAAVGTPAHAAALAGKYHYIAGNLTAPGNGVLDGLYYVAGLVDLHGSGIHGTATIVTPHTFDFAGSSFTLEPYVDRLVLFSTASGAKRCDDPVIDINGGGNSLANGYIYAPNGMVRVSGATKAEAIAGWIVADAIRISGKITVKMPPVKGVPTGCEGYDLLATADETRISSRMLYCAGQQPQILSWSLIRPGE